MEGHEAPHRATDGGSRSQGCVSAMIARVPRVYVSHDSKGCHSTWSTRTASLRPQRKPQPKDASLCFTGGSRVHRTQGQVPITMQGEVTCGALPSHRSFRNSTRPPSPSAHSKKGFLSGHRPLWPASPSVPSSSLVVGSKERAASEYKEVPTTLAVSVCPCHGVGLSSLGCEDGSEHLLHPRGSRRHEPVTSWG